MKISAYIQNKYHYSDYQMKVLHYFFISILSEISKFLIMGAFFLYFSQFLCYLWAVSLLWILRFTSGGLHCKTYIGCLLSSFLYLFLSIQVMPLFPLPELIRLVLLLLCILVAYHIAPVPSQFRQHINQTQTTRYRTYLFILLFVYFIVMFIFPHSHYLIVGFWVIMIHTMQLMVAHKRKEVNTHEVHKA